VNIYGGGDDLSFTINNSDTAGVQSFSASGANDQLVTSGSTLDLSHTTVSGFRVVSTNAQGTTFTVSDLGTAFQIAGGPGQDTMVAQGFTFTADQRDTIFKTSSIEQIVDGSGAYRKPGLPITIYTTLSDPSAYMGTYASSLSDNGSVVGYYMDSNDAYHSFIYCNAAYTTLDDPSVGIQPRQQWIIARAINASGETAGYYSDSMGVHGFIYSNGIYSTLDDPLAGTQIYQDTYASAINASGQVAGYFRAGLGNLNKAISGVSA